MTSDLAVVVVTYNSADCIAPCLDSVRDCPEVVVVDNASQDATRDAVRSGFPNVQWIGNSTNRGFAAAVNQGIAATAGEAVLLLNPDAQVLGGLPELVAELCDPKVGAAAGRLVDHEDRFQSGFSVRRLPTPATLAAEALLLHRIWPANPWNRHYRCFDFDPRRAQDCEQPAGAFFLLRRQAWQRLGGFDERFYPLWFEDVDFCWRLRQAGYRIRYQPAAIARHAGGHSLRSVTQRQRHAYWYRSLLRFVDKRFPPAAAPLRACVAAGLALRATGSLLFAGDVGRSLAYLRAIRSAATPEPPVSRSSAVARTRGWKTDRTPKLNGKDLVSVTVVTFNSGRFIRRCLESVLDQRHAQLEVIVIDNASTDGTADILERFESRCKVVYNERNLGFAGAQNQAIELSRGEWILTLNPDVMLLPDFVATLMETARRDPDVGTLCGKLLMVDASFKIPDQQVLDSTGIYFTPMLRHFDRGCLEKYNGHYRHQEYVFGATAAAAMYRRRMIEDVSVNGEFFDPDFFTYREDADVAWRSQLLGWKCVYDPSACGYHVRKLRPGMRRALSPEINMHSVKNRFLMRVKNITPQLYLQHFLPITFRDLSVLAYCLLFERSSLKAFYLVARDFRKTLAKRRQIQSRRRAGDSYLAQWFRFEPTSLPLEKEVAREAAVAAE